MIIIWLYGDSEITYKTHIGGEISDLRVLGIKCFVTHEDGLYIARTKGLAITASSTKSNIEARQFFYEILRESFEILLRDGHLQTYLRENGWR